MDKKSLGLIAVALLGSVMQPENGWADEWDFDYRINTQLWGGVQDLQDDSVLNPDNTFELPEQFLQLDFRPDLSLSNDHFLFSIKPRAEWVYNRVEQADGSTDNDSDSDVFMLEWLARANLGDSASLSYGRENLQWGPALFLSASNPFFQVNGRDRPQQEVGGMDYARFIWVASDSWTTSLIVNTDEGLQDITDHSTSFAVKVDYTGEGHYFSLIPSYRQSTETQQEVAALGFFGGLSIGDAVLAYAEGSLVKEGDSNQGLLGVSYTFSGGASAVLEYYRQQDGCTHALIETCLLPGQSPLNLERTRLLGRDYLFLQFSKDWDLRRTLLTVRAAHNINDSSNRFIVQFNRAFGDYWSGFVVGTVTTGDENTEFGSLIKSSLEIGVELTF